MALGRIILIILTILIVISLLFVSGCQKAEPGPEDLFNPDTMKEMQNANPSSAEFPEPGSSNEDFDIEKFFPQE